MTASGPDRMKTTVELDADVLEQLRITSVTERISTVSILRALTRAWASDPELRRSINESAHQIDRAAKAQRQKGREMT